MARNTVLTTLSRLHAKGWLRCRREGNTFLYSAAHPRRHVLGGMLSRLIETAFGGSASSMVLHLLEANRLSPQEARQIRDLIDRAARKREGHK